MRGSGGPFPWASAQTERVQDWHSLERHADIRVNLADHAANTTCSLLASSKISERTPARVRPACEYFEPTPVCATIFALTEESRRVYWDTCADVKAEEATVGP